MLACETLSPPAAALLCWLETKATRTPIRKQQGKKFNMYFPQDADIRKGNRRLCTDLLLCDSLVLACGTLSLLVPTCCCSAVQVKQGLGTHSFHTKVRACQAHFHFLLRLTIQILLEVLPMLATVTKPCLFRSQNVLARLT